MSFVFMIMIGLIVAAVAALLAPWNGPGGAYATIFVAIAGSTIAGLSGLALDHFQGLWEGRGFISSAVGAMALLLLYRRFGPLLWSRFKRR